MKIVFFASVYPPDLGAGSFRSVALAEAIVKKISMSDNPIILADPPRSLGMARHVYMQPPHPLCYRSSEFCAKIPVSA